MKCLTQTIKSGWVDALCARFKPSLSLSYLVLFSISLMLTTISSAQASRITLQPEVYYTFMEGSGNVIYDQSGHADSTDLVIADPTKVTWGQCRMALT